MGEWETLREIVANGARSLAAATASGRSRPSIKNQDADPEAGARIREVLRSDDERGCSWAYRTSGRVRAYRTTRPAFWAAWRNDRLTGLLEPGKLYWSAFITRTDSAPRHRLAELLATHAKRVGPASPAGDGLGQGAAVPADARQRQLDRPARRATAERVDRYGELYSACRDFGRANPDGVVVLSLGPTATVLAADLAADGCKHWIWGIRRVLVALDA